MMYYKHIEDINEEDYLDTILSSMDEDEDMEMFEELEETLPEDNEDIDKDN